MGPSLDTGIEARKRVLHRQGTGFVLDDPAGGPSCGTTHAPLQRARLSVRGLTANECDRDMPQRRIGRGGMPMAFTGLAVYDVTHIDLTLFMLRCGSRPHYSITSSARASSMGGMARPSALAVLRLMTSSYRVGCSTGRSAGLLPFRILSTNTAARR